MKRKALVSTLMAMTLSLSLVLPVYASGDGLIGNESYEQEVDSDSDSDMDQNTALDNEDDETAAQEIQEANAAASASNGDGLVNGETYEQENECEDLDLYMTAVAHVNIRQTPNGTILGVLEQGQDIHVLGNMDDISWYKVDFNGQTAYIYDDYLTPDFPQTMAATHNVNVRVAPYIGATILGSLSVGEKVKVTDLEDGWYKFTYEETGDIGYSHANYLAAVSEG